LQRYRSIRSTAWAELTTQLLCVSLCLSVLLFAENPELLTITAKCEREEYGRYKPGSNHGRCSDSDIIQVRSPRPLR
jgi:hypothetical protein